MRIDRLGFLSASLLAVVVPAVAQPANDNWANRKTIPALPFDDLETDIGAATLEAATDPIVVCQSRFPTQGGNTVWYSYTTGASTEYLTLDTGGSNYTTLLTVYTGSPGTFRMVAGGCRHGSQLAGLRLRPDTTYSIEVARVSPSPSAAALRFLVRAAARYVVNTTQDVWDGACSADSCSLREAIVASNVHPGAVLLAAGTYVLEHADIGETTDLDVASGMGIYGAGADHTRIDGNQRDRVLHLRSGGTVLVADLTITNGTDSGDGGGIFAEGVGFLWIEGVTVAGNVAGGRGGGVRMLGRGIITRTTIAMNQAGIAGGGLSAVGPNDTRVEVRETTIADNTSLGTGGGVHSSSRVRFTNVTISGNRAHTHGGGLHALVGGAVAILSSTIAGNIADFDANSTGNGGGLRLDNLAPTTITHTVITDNVDRNASAAPECSTAGMTVLTTSYNHVETVAGGCGFTGTGDVTGTDAEISPLADHGGPTLTHAPLAGSPVIDAGDPAGCQDDQGFTLSTDQRLMVRHFDGDGDGVAVCDKGSVEFGAEDVIFRDGFESVG
jgi:CSLREA domain-containing protein